MIGGTSLFGGRGEIRDALIGALVIATIANGLNTLGFTRAMIFIVTGSILLFAVTLDTILRRRQQRKRDASRRARQHPLATIAR